MPTLNRNTARSAASVSASEARLTLAEHRHVQRQAEHAAPRAPRRTATCSANQTARLRITPTTAAVIAASAADERLVAAQRLDEGRAEEDPQEARHEGHPGGEQAAQARRRAAGGSAPGIAEGAHEADELDHHDQRPRRGLGHAEAVQHLAGLEPAVGLDRLLRDVGEHGVGAAEGDHRHLREEDGDLAEDVAGAERQQQQRATGPSQSTRQTAATCSDQESGGRACAGSSSPSAVSASATALPVAGAVPAAGEEGREAGAPAEEADQARRRG